MSYYTNKHDSITQDIDAFFERERLYPEEDDRPYDFCLDCDAKIAVEDLIDYEEGEMVCERCEEIRDLAYKMFDLEVIK